MTRQVSETVQNPPEKQPAPVRLLEVDLSTGSARSVRFESEWGDGGDEEGDGEDGGEEDGEGGGDDEGDE